MIEHLLSIPELLGSHPIQSDSQESSIYTFYHCPHNIQANAKGE